MDAYFTTARRQLSFRQNAPARAPIISPILYTQKEYRELQALEPLTFRLLWQWVRENDRAPLWRPIHSLRQVLAARRIAMGYRYQIQETDLRLRRKFDPTVRPISKKQARLLKKALHIELLNLEAQQQNLLCSFFKKPKMTVHQAAEILNNTVPAKNNRKAQQLYHQLILAFSLEGTLPAKPNSPANKTPVENKSSEASTEASTTGKAAGPNIIGLISPPPVEVDQDVNTALHRAILENDKNLKRIIQDSPSAVFTMQNKNGDTPLHLVVQEACRRGNQMFMAIAPVMERSKRNIRANDGYSFLDIPSLNNGPFSKDALTWILQYPLPITLIAPEKHDTPIHLAAVFQAPEIAQLWINYCRKTFELKERQKIFNARNQQGETAAFIAIDNAINSTANIDTRLAMIEPYILPYKPGDNDSPWTFNTRGERISDLSLNVPNNKGITPLENAISVVMKNQDNESLILLRRLLEDYAIEYGLALHVLAESDFERPEVASILFSNINSKKLINFDKNDNTAIHIAFKKQRHFYLLEAIKNRLNTPQLINLINYKNKNGDTSLHLLAENSIISTGNKDFFPNLLKNYIEYLDPTITNQCE